VSLALYSHWRATAPYRVRIGLALKGLAYDYLPLDLAKGAQHAPAYRALNPQALSPALVADGVALTQSLAILEWLDETCPEPPLLPKDPLGRARVRAMAGVVACDIHPLNNLRVDKALQALAVSDAERRAWAVRWIADGFSVLEPMIARDGAGFAYGDAATLADCCLVPQVWAAEARYGLDLSPWPALAAAARCAMAHPAFEAAHPDRQPKG
jgi:maleylacetoacetate isomerase/maleylpyruvate isomerase